MAVKITKPSINIREKLSELDKPAGIAGEAMLRAETPQEQFELIGAGRKNLIINGDFRIDQYGKLSSTPYDFGNSEYVIDRWTAHSTVGDATVKKGDVVVNGVTRNALRIDAPTGTGGYIGLRTSFDLKDIIIGKTYTISALVRTNNPYVRIRQNDIGGSDSDATQTHPGDGSWQRLSMTVDSSNTTNPIWRLWVIAYDNGSVQINSGDYIEVTEFQMEEGNVATPFEHRSYGEELALCQRYYQIHYPLGSGVQNSATVALVMVHLPVPMRVFPTLGTRLGDYSNINVEHDDTYDVTSITLSHGIDGSGLDELSTFIANVNTSGSNTVGYGVCVMCDRNGDWFTFDAEL